MITANDIKLLVASGEGYNAEFKVSLPLNLEREAIRETHLFLAFLPVCNWLSK